MKRIFRRAASFVICALMLFAASFTVSAAGNALESNVFLIGGVKITGISEDIELPSGGGTTLLVEVANSGTTTLTYFWEVSSDGGKTFTAAPGTNDQSSYKITNAQQNPNDPLLPYVYRVTVSGSVGDSSAVTTASEAVRVLVRDADDYEYTTRIDPNGTKVTAVIERAFSRYRSCHGIVCHSSKNGARWLLHRWRYRWLDHKRRPGCPRMSAI